MEWKRIASGYLMAQGDQAINLDLERFYARRMKAKTVEAKSSHGPFISRPKGVAHLIEEAEKAIVE